MTRSKNKRLRLIPSHLPLIRDKLADFAQYRLRELGSQTQYEAMMANAWSMTDQIRTAQLWWVSRDMTRLAEDTVQAGDFDDHMAPACREALELARREADDPSWLDGFFQRAQGDYLICWYARWHPESGLSIPTREQWDDFLEELKSNGVIY